MARAWHAQAKKDRQWSDSYAEKMTCIGGADRGRVRAVAPSILGTACLPNGSPVPLNKLSRIRDPAAGGEGPFEIFVEYRDQSWTIGA